MGGSPLFIPTYDGVVCALLTCSCSPLFWYHLVLQIEYAARASARSTAWSVTKSSEQEASSRLLVLATVAISQTTQTNDQTNARLTA